jgi:hypothetical protein
MSKRVQFGVAGVPKSLGATRDYDRIFSQLKSSGMSVFFGTFQFQEVPTGLSLGFERDFLAPCSATDTAFVALKTHNIKLLVPGNLLYPTDAELPSLDDDPLRQLIACAGVDGVFGVTTYDEPAHTNVTDAQLQRFYDRVKLVQPSLPVLMIHAPLFDDQSPAEQKDYLDRVVRQSAFADIVGFDVYPVPAVIAKVPNPDGAIVDDPADTVAAYMTWIRQAAPTKSYLIVLQGHSIANVYSDEERDKNAPEVLKQVRAPSLKETQDMTRRAIDGNASVVVWWGPSFVKSDSTEPWCAIRSTVAQLTNSTAPGAMCGDNLAAAAIDTTSIAWLHVILVLLLCVMQ